MKKLILLTFFVFSQLFAQQDSLRPANSVYKNFKPFSTPRTNFRPGTVYRIDESGIMYLVQDVNQVKSLECSEGTITGRMIFTKEELVTSLNIEFDIAYITTEVEVKDALREVTEQTNVDYILWDYDLVDELVVDPKSKYYIVRETVSTKEITYRFDAAAVEHIVKGKGNLKEKLSTGTTVIDYPFSITKRFSEPKRLLFLEQEIGLDPYSEE